MKHFIVGLVAFAGLVVCPVSARADVTLPVTVVYGHPQHPVAAVEIAKGRPRLPLAEMRPAFPLGVAATSQKPF